MATKRKWTLRTFPGEEKVEQPKNVCIRCGYGQLTWQQMRWMYGRKLKAGMPIELAKQLGPCCDMHTTQLIRAWRVNKGASAAELLQCIKINTYLKSGKVRLEVGV